MTNRTKSATLFAVAILALGSLTGCSMANDEPPRLEQPTMEERVTPMEESEPAFTVPEEVDLPSGSSPLGVVTAGILMASGDVTKALENGQITPSEVKYAALAIEEGTLDQWRMLAEASE